MLLRGPIISCFTGVLYYAIANIQSSQEDIQLLQDFVVSLRAARTFSEPIEKFYQLCLAFSRVATSYVRAKAQQQTTGDGGPTNSSILRPEPNPQTQAGEAFNQGSATMSQYEMRHPLEVSQDVQEWYAGNASLYGLLEQDFDYDLFAAS